MPKKPLYEGKITEKTHIVENVLTDRIKYVLIQSLIEAHLAYAGRVSGKQYEWMKSGDTVSVLEEDVPELLEKRLGGNSCCGTPVGNKIFQLVVEV